MSQQLGSLQTNIGWKTTSTYRRSSKGNQGMHLHPGAKISEAPKFVAFFFSCPLLDTWTLPKSFSSSFPLSTYLKRPLWLYTSVIFFSLRVPLEQGQGQGLGLQVNNLSLLCFYGSVISPTPVVRISLRISLTINISIIVSAL